MRCVPFRFGISVHVRAGADADAQSVLVAYLEFVEATHVVDILREAGPDGLDVAGVARAIGEIRRGPAGSADVVEVDPAKVGACRPCFVFRARGA